MPCITFSRRESFSWVSYIVANGWVAVQTTPHYTKKGYYLVVKVNGLDPIGVDRELVGALLIKLDARLLHTTFSLHVLLPTHWCVYELY